MLNSLPRTYFVCGVSTPSRRRIRSGPSPQSPTIAVIEVGARIVVTHVEMPWMRVKFDSASGVKLTGWTRATQEDNEGRHHRYLYKAQVQTPRIAGRVYTGWRRGTPALPASVQTVLLVDRFETAAVVDVRCFSLDRSVQCCVPPLSPRPPSPPPPPLFFCSCSFCCCVITSRNTAHFSLSSCAYSDAARPNLTVLLPPTHDPFAHILYTIASTATTR
jgi:hypothetical protein